MRKSPALMRPKTGRSKKTSAAASFKNRGRMVHGARKAFITATFLSAFAAQGQVNHTTTDENPLFNIGYGTENTETNPVTLSLGDIITLAPEAAIHSLNVGRTNDGVAGTGTLILDGGSVVIDDSGATGGYGGINIGRGLDSTGLIQSTGTVQHHSGTVTVSNGAFQIGMESGQGSYHLSGGSISLGRHSTTNIGHGTGGVGTLTISNNATFTRGTAEDQVTGGFSIGSAGGTGTITQNGSDSTVSIVGGPLRFGVESGSKGTYNLSAGHLTMLGSVGIVLGEDAGSEGSFIQSGGTSEFLYSSAGHPTLRVGKGGTGVFTVSGGTATVGKSILLADGEDSSGTINLTGTGVLEIGGANAGGTISKGAGTATFNMAGGTLRSHEDATSGVIVSVAPELEDGTTSTFDTNGNSIILTEGFTGTGGFANVGAGALILGGSSVLGGDSTSEGDLIIGGPGAPVGALALAPNTELTVYGGSNLIIGRNTGSIGTLSIGPNATIILDNTDGATNNFDVGDNGGTGVVNMTGGLVDFKTTHTSGYNRLRIGSGDKSTGAFNQSGGIVDTDVGSFSIGYEGGTGAYNLSGDAKLLSGNVVHIGRGLRNNSALTTSGTMTLTGNSSFELIRPDGVAESWLYLGRWYSEGSILQQDTSEVTLEVAGLILGTNAGGSGVEKTAKGQYDLEGGTLTVKASYVRLGETADSTGEFTQSGGTSSFAEFPGSSAKNAIIVGDKGEGTFTLSGGTSTLHHGMILASAAGSKGTLAVNGAGILVTGGNISKGAGVANFDLAGGTLRAHADATDGVIVSVAPDLEIGTTSTFDTNGNSITLSNGFTGDGGFAKIGGGALIVGGQNVLVGNSSVEQGDLVIGGLTASNSSLTINTGTTLSVKGTESYLTVGRGAGQKGTLNLNGGTIHIDTATGPNNFYVGTDGGIGLVEMTDGIINAAQTTSYSRIVIGYTGGTGTFNQKGGTVNGTGGAFYLGSTGGGTGQYTLSNSAVLNLGITAYIGRNTGIGFLEIRDSATVNMFEGDVGLHVGIGGGTGTIDQDGATSNVSIAHGGAVRFGSEGVGSTGTYRLKAGTLTVDHNGDTAYGVTFGHEAGTTGNFEQSGGISSFMNKLVHVGHEGTGNFTVSGGTSTIGKALVLGHAAGAVGTLTLSGGTLEVGGADGIRKGDGTAYIHLEGGTLSAVGSSELTSSVDMTLKEGTTTTILTDEANASLSGVLSGLGALKKDGAGILTLAGINSYTGSTEITAGTLIVAGSGTTGTGAVVIGVNATLSGSGLVRGAAIVHGSLNPGNSPGNLSFAQGLTLSTGSVTTLEITGPGAGLYDTLSVTNGVLVLDGILRLDFTQGFNDAFSSNLFLLSGGATLTGNFEDVLLISAFGDHSFAQDGTNWTLDLDGRLFTFEASTGAFDIAAIPEPGTWALLISGAAGLWMLRRRRTAV